MTKIILACLLLITILLLSCGEDTVNNTEDPVEYTYTNFAKFSGMNYIMLREDMAGKNTPPEIYLWWEKVIGEPFIDNNANGIYDDGVDTYTDLNQNSQYDGPNDPWSQGVPFDDVNEDGMYIVNPNWGSSITKTLLTPYVDYNENGVWDSDLAYTFDIIQCQLISDTNYIKTYGFEWVDSAYHFVSDSGYNYYLPTNMLTTDKWTFYEFIEHPDSGLIFSRPASTFKLFDTGQIVTDPDFYTDTALGNYGIPFEIQKKVTIDQSLTVEGKTYNNLVKVEAFYQRGYSDTYDHWSFYLDSNIGLIAINFIEDWDNSEVWYYYDKSVASVPRQLSR